MTPPDHTCPTSIHLPTDCCLPEGPEELKRFSLKHSPFIYIPHWGTRKEKWEIWWRPPLIRWLHDLSRDELVQKYLPTSWPGHWAARYSGTSLTWRVLACRGMQRHAEEFRSKKGGTFQAELSMFRSFFRNRRTCRNNSFKNYLYITEKGLPNTTWR